MYIDEMVNVRPSDLKINKRKSGISGFIRARNEEDWLGLTIDSHLPFLDEIVIVYNRCEDNTPEVAQYYEKLYPDKIKVFHYLPDVFPQGSQECSTLHPTHESSLVNYYNYALCKTTRQIALKVDGDQIAIPEAYRQMCSIVKRGIFKMYYTFRGINLWDQDGKVYVKGSEPVTCYDRGFFLVNPTTWHMLDKDRALEIFHGGNLPSKQYQNFAYYHTKGMKKDRGINNYDLKDNPNSRYHDVVKKYYTSPGLITIDEFKQKNPDFSNGVLPESLGIKSIQRL